MELRVYADAEALAAAAAELFRARADARPDLVMAVPAGRTPRRMYAVMQGEVCDRAVSLGVRTILSSREVVVLVSGAHKRMALRAALHGPITPDVPASVLQQHPNCVVLADATAAP